MRARSFSALFGVIAFFMAGMAALMSGCASGHKQFVYVVGPGTNEVFEFRSERTGALAPLGTPNFAVGSNPVSLAAHTSGNFLYIADFSGNDVTQLDINKSNGNLSVPATTSIVVPVNPPNIFPTGNAPASVAMSPTGPFLFVANQLSGDKMRRHWDGIGEATRQRILGAEPAEPQVLRPAIGGAGKRG